MKTIITVQHTESEHHRNKMVGSWADWNLTEEGFRQAEQIAKNLFHIFGKENFTLYSSDLARAQQTAEIIGGHFGIVPQLRSGMREIHCGNGNGKPQEWFELNKLPESSSPCRLDYRPLPDAESNREFLRRVGVVLDEILTLPSDNIMLVGHGGWFSMFCFLWLFEDVGVFEHTFLRTAPGGVSLFQLEDNKRSLLCYNDLQYLKP